MAFRIIKQASNKKVEVYCEWILKLANCFQHKVDNNLLTTFFQTGLVPYSWIVTIKMKRDTLFEHKEFVVTYEKIMVDVKEYKKLLEPWKKLEKTQDKIEIKKMCGFCHKSRHLKEQCHWNPKNPNNKLKKK